MPFHIIPFLLLVVPIAEISAFVVIGGRIGLFPTLGLILLTAIIGSILLRWQGLSTLARINADVQAGRVPGRDLADGAMILVAGVLLLTPGFVTDAMGFLLFVPALRDAAWRFLKSRITIVASSPIFPGGDRPQDSNQGARDRRAPVVDLDEAEFSRSGGDTGPDAGSGRSPWSNDDKSLPGKDKPGDKKQDGL